MIFETKHFIEAHYALAKERRRKSEEGHSKRTCPGAIPAPSPSNAAIIRRIVNVNRSRAGAWKVRKASPQNARANGSVLVGLLWCLALLSVIVIGLLHTASLDLRVVKNHGDQIQAHYLALAGIEKAKALLYQDAAARKRAAKNHSGELYDAPDDFRDIPLGRGQYRVFHQGGRDDGGKLMYGIIDEESRLNINTASSNELTKLYGMTPDVVAAIVDFRDGDSTVTPGGAEAEYYASLQPPYLPRNAPLQTPRELSMIRGISRELLMGEDTNQNGLLDQEEDDGNASYPPDNRDGVLDAGWSGELTFQSSVRNVNAAGQERVNVQSADEKALTVVRGLSADIARAIVAYRGQNRLESLADLLDVSAPAPQNQAPPPPPSNSVQAGPGQAGPARASGPTSGSSRPSGQQPAPSTGNPGNQAGGPKLISEDLLIEIADDLTAGESNQSQEGAININTASSTVLACLPGITQEIAQAIVSYRRSAGFFPNTAGLLKVPGMTRQIFKQVVPKVSARSETFRILSEGKVTSTGARKRILVTVRLGSYGIDTLSYREDL